ncbi:MAG: hypothetical protein RLY86_2558 [Pseudomonadota bacterium]|jgi:antitoxin CcdA
MTTPPRRNGAKQAANLSISGPLLAEARRLGLSLSQAAERGIDLAVTEAREAQWPEENREALESSNAFVARHGLPLARYRGL